jgi:hypothetical protein
MQKAPYLGWWPSVQGANLTPLWSNVENLLPCFLQATGLTPSPSLPPFQPHVPTHATQFFILREDDISMSEAFFACHNNRCI